MFLQSCLNKSFKNYNINIPFIHTAALTGVGVGSSMAWSSPALSYLTSPKSHIPMTKQQSDFTAALLPVGMILGYLLNPVIINRVGRKWTLMIYSLPQIVCWTLTILAEKMITLYIARLIGGIGYGGGLGALTIYISEIGTLKNRGILLALISLSINCGLLYTMLLGAFLSYNCMNFSLLALPIIFVVTFSFMPDSFYFYEENNQIDENRTNLMNLKGLEEEATNESKLVESNLRKIENNHTSKIILKESLWKLFTYRSNRRALIILSFTCFVSVFSGNIPLTFFTQQVFTHSGSTFSAETSAVIIVAIKVASALISTQVIERVRRKVLFFTTGITGAISMGLAGTYFLLEEKKFEVSFFRWVPLFAVILYELMAVSGPCNLFYIYQSELFNNDVKSVSVTYGKIFYMVLSFLSLFRFQVTVDKLGVYTMFFLFAICGTVGTLVVCMITPETKGIRLSEIQIMLKSKRTFFY